MLAEHLEKVREQAALMKRNVVSSAYIVRSRYTRDDRRTACEG